MAAFPQELALVGLDTSIRSDIERPAEVAHSKAASLLAVVEDIAIDEVYELAAKIQGFISYRHAFPPGLRERLIRNPSKFAAFKEKAGGSANLLGDLT